MCFAKKGGGASGQVRTGAAPGRYGRLIFVEFSFLRLCPSFFIAFYVLCKKERRGIGAGVRCGERLYGLC